MKVTQWNQTKETWLLRQNFANISRGIKTSRCQLYCQNLAKNDQILPDKYQSFHSLLFTSFSTHSHDFSWKITQPIEIKRSCEWVVVTFTVTEREQHSITTYDVFTPVIQVTGTIYLCESIMWWPSSQKSKQYLFHCKKLLWFQSIA